MAALHHEDYLNYLIKLEQVCSDPHLKHIIQTLRLLISILRPFVRFLFMWHIQHEKMDVHLKHMFNMVQQISCAFVPQPRPCLENVRIITTRNLEDSLPKNAELVASSLKTLKSLKEDIVRIVTLRASYPYDKIVWKDEVEDLIHFIKSLSQNLKDIGIICKAGKVTNVKKELADVKQRLKFLATFLRLIAEPLILFVVNAKVVARSAEKLAVKISCNLFLFLMDDELVAADHMKEDILPGLLRNIDALILELRQLYNGSCLTSPIMNEHVLGFVDYCISKLRQLARVKVEVKVQMQILADEPRFIRSNLMDVLLHNPNMTFKKMKSLSISTEALVINPGFFIYFSLDQGG
ncbi:hypothetical protein ACH5RR_034461 [Cinchona calisaya]|uniref:Uncharacterized protein n=1 Tax=Cinchona calisaya TaxID=153742 RepID=A0ABD2YBN1_9GENT